MLTLPPASVKSLSPDRVWKYVDQDGTGDPGGAVHRRWTGVWRLSADRLATERPEEFPFGQRALGLYTVGQAEARARAGA